MSRLRLAFLIPAILILTAVLTPTTSLGDSEMPQQAPTEQAPQPQLDLDILFDDDAPGANVSQLAWRPGGEDLLGFFKDGDGDAWWLFRLDADGSLSQTLLARPADLGVEKASEVNSLTWSDDGRHLLVSTADGFALFDPAKRALRRLTDTAGGDPKLSPDGSRLAFVKDDELWMAEIAADAAGDGDTEPAEPRRLTFDGEPAVVFNAVTDWVYWEELWGRDSTGFWWSPDGQRIAYYHIDDRQLPIYTMLDTRPLYPELERQRYPKAGDVLPKVEIRVLDLETGETTRLAVGDDPLTPRFYLPRVHWHPDGEQIAVERLNREQNHLEVLLCSRLDSSCRTLAEQKAETWVNLPEDFQFLADGRFLWSSEEAENDGWRQLYVYTADGKGRRRLTPDGWTLTSVDAVQEAKNRLVFTAHAVGELGAAERHVFAARLNGAAPSAEKLTEDPGWHGAQVSESGPWVHTWNDIATPTRQALRSLDAPAQNAELPSTPPSYDPAKLPRWEITTLPGPAGSRLPAQILKPPGFDPAKRYPVVMYHYGCPASQVVANRWSGTGRGLWHVLLAERGYVVVQVDNGASTFFGKRGEEIMHRRFGEVELAAQLAAVDWLKAQSWVDPGRLGLWGWSGGGSNTLYSLFRAPGVWKAGIAGAPVTDWRYYDAIWIERYLDHPAGNAEGYEASSPITYAENLTDALLLVHGTADNNVHPQNSWNLTLALVKAGRPFDQAFYPGARHSLSSFPPGGERHLFAKMTEFFDRHLKP